MDRASSTILNNSDQKKNKKKPKKQWQEWPSLSSSWIQEEGFQLFTIEYYVGPDFVINDLYHVEICFFYTHFDESFYYEWILNFINVFLGIYWDDHVGFLSFC